MPVFSASEDKLCAKCWKTLLSLSAGTGLAYSRSGTLQDEKLEVNIKDPESWFLWNETDEYRDQLLQSTQQLVSSARICLFCSLIFAGLSKSWRRYWWDPSNASISSEVLEQCVKELGNDPVILMPSRENEWFPWPEGWVSGLTPIGASSLDLMRCNMSEQVPRDRSGHDSIPIYAELGSSAARTGTVSGRRPFENPNSPDTFGFIRNCLDTCNAHHRICQARHNDSMIPKGSKRVPARLLDLGIGKSFDEIRLVENGIKGLGPYVALSHCWGVPEKRPLTTTRANLHQRLVRIPWDSLPLTFRDAVIVTKGIGLRYLWIDSLCILQDDGDDWRKESAKMDEVFKKAYLTLAASHAQNSSEGLFCKRPTISLLRVPLGDISSPHEDTIFLGASWETELHTLDDPDRGALCKRAWVIQEWILSRRIIFFTRGLLFWFCREASIDETGHHRDMKWSTAIQRYVTTLSTRDADLIYKQTALFERWSRTVEIFTSRDITYLTDRLMALEGLRVEQQRSRSGDSYILGHWKGDLPLSLCWETHNANRSANPLAVPSWSWPSATGAVKWYQLLSFYRTKCKILSICPIGAQLTIEGHITKFDEEVSKRGNYYVGRMFKTICFLDDKDYDHLLAQNLTFFFLVATENNLILSDEDHHIGLLLKPAEAWAETYVRLGLAKIQRNDLFPADDSARVIKII